MTQDLTKEQIENMNLTRGHKEYDSKVKNLEGIFKKIEKILDISKYKEAFLTITSEVNDNPNLSSKMLDDMHYNEMQLDYEGFTYGVYNKKLDDLTKEIEKDLLPFYELYLLYTKINMQISDINGENIGEIILNTKSLIDTLNSLNTHNIKDKNNIINSAYQTIYSVIMYEEIFERNDTLSYINKLNIPANKENIGRLLSQDLNNINKKDIIDEDLKNIKIEGLGYDYLNTDFIRKISRKTVGESNSEYQARKRQTIKDLSEKAEAIILEKNVLTTNIKNNNKSIRNLYINKTFLATRALSLVLVPILTFGAGRAIGKSMSNKITEYQTITRTVNSDTGEIIGEQKIIYDEKETTYVATVTAYTPWRKNPTGVGYVRNATAYEYIAPENIEEGYHATTEDLENNVLEKYKYVESKDTLEETDSTTESTILITETYQDKNINRKSTKYIIPLSITGSVLGIVIDIILMMLGVCNLEKIKKIFEKLNNDIKKYKLSNKEIKDRLLETKNEVLLLQDEYNDTVKKYGEWKDEPIYSELDTSWIKDYNKTKIRIK